MSSLPAFPTPQRTVARSASPAVDARRLWAGRGSPRTAETLARTKTAFESLRHARPPPARSGKDGPEAYINQRVESSLASCDNFRLDHSSAMARCLRLQHGFRRQSHSQLWHRCQFRALRAFDGLVRLHLARAAVHPAHAAVHPAHVAVHPAHAAGPSRAEQRDLDEDAPGP